MHVPAGGLMTTRRRTTLALVLLLAVTPGLVACGRSRDDYEQDFKQLVLERGTDLSPSQVDCVIDGFFADMSDAEVRAFSRRDELTPTEAQRIRDLTTSCRAAN